MALAYRIRVVSTGLDGGPYLSTFIYSASLVTDPSNAMGALSGFIQAIRTRVSTNCVMSAQPDVETFDVESGDIATTTAVATFSLAGLNSNPISWTAKQGVLKLRTNTFRSGRRVHGRL